MKLFEWKAIYLKKFLYSILWVFIPVVVIAQTYDAVKEKKKIASEVWSLTQTLKTKPNINSAYLVRQSLSAIHNRSPWIAENPKDPLAIKFKSLGLLAYELTTTNEYLDRCASHKGKAIGSLIEESDEISERLLKKFTKTNCINCDAAPRGAAADLYKTTAFFDKLNQDLKGKTQTAQESLTIGLTNEKMIREVLAYQRIKQLGDIRNNNPIPLYNTIEFQKSEAQAMDAQVKMIQRKSGVDPDEIGPEAKSYVTNKYGLYPPKQEAVQKAAELHKQVIQGNRENCLRNYLYYSQHFDFSDEPKVTEQNGVKSAFENLFCNGSSFCKDIEGSQQSTATKVGLEELKRIKSKYTKPVLSLDEVYQQLKPILERLKGDQNEAEKEYQDARKNSKVRALDNDQLWMSQKAEMSRFMAKQARLSGAEQKALQSAAQSEVGFLLHTKAFKDSMRSLSLMGESQTKELLKSSLKSAIEASRKYAQEFIVPHQGFTKSGSSKSVSDYANTGKVLLYSSPVTIQKTIENTPTLLGSLCAPMKAAANDRRLELPWWIEYGGGAMMVVGFVPGVGQLAAATFGVVAAGVRVANANEKTKDLKLVKQYAGLGDAQEDRDYEREARVQKETDAYIKIQEDEKSSAVTTGMIDVALAGAPSVLKAFKNRQAVVKFLDEMKIPKSEYKATLFKMQVLTTEAEVKISNELRKGTNLGARKVSTDEAKALYKVDQHKLSFAEKKELLGKAGFSKQEIDVLLVPKSNGPIKLAEKRIEGHVLSGEFKEITRVVKGKTENIHVITGGMHTDEGLQSFLKLRPDLSNQVVSETLSNGVIQVKIPASGFNKEASQMIKRSSKKGFGFYDEEKQLLGKTLFPTSWSKEEIKVALKQVAQKGEIESVQSGTIYKVGEYKGVKIQVTIQENEVRTGFPLWTQ